VGEQRNPYRTAPGSEPPELAGRFGELGAARYALDMTATGEPAKPLVFTGLRGMGKTALLRRVAREAQAMGALTILEEADRSLRFADVMQRELSKALAGTESFPSRLRAAIGRTVDLLPKISFELPSDAGGISIEGRQTDDDSPPAESLEAALDAINEQLHRHGRFLLVGLDELQESPADDLLRIVRAVHRSAGTERPILFVGAGLPNSSTVLKAARTYTERWAYYRLELLDRSQVFDALDLPARSLGSRWEEAALEEVFLRSRGYPYFVQEYAAASWLRHRGSEVTHADVLSVVPGVQRMLDENLYDRQFLGLTPREAAFVLALRRLGEGPHRSEEIAHAMGVKSSAEVSSIRTQLVKKDIIYAPARGLSEFRMPLTDDYVARHEAAILKRAALGNISFSLE
jgi:hypothetical protein